MSKPCLIVTTSLRISARLSKLGINNFIHLDDLTNVREKIPDGVSNVIILSVDDFDNTVNNELETIGYQVRIYQESHSSKYTKIEGLSEFMGNNNDAEKFEYILKEFCYHLV